MAIEPSRRHIGVDISKSTLDAHMHPDGDKICVQNDISGFRRLLAWMSRYDVTQLIYEPTGQYHLAFERFFLKAGVPLGKVNPRQARRFADAIGVMAKTDCIDAGLLARSGALVTIRPVSDRTIKFNEMKELQSARRALVKDRIRASNRSAARIAPLLRRHARERVEQVDRQLKAIDEALRQLVREDEILKAKSDILRSIPGIGETTAIMLLTEMPELGEIDHKAAASLAGLAPVARDSGTYRGKRHIQGGRAHLRQALYMPALVSIKHNPDFRAKYDVLVAAGKAPKLAITVVMRKLIILANSLLRDGRIWSSSMA
jgi:transposase